MSGVRPQSAVGAPEKVSSLGLDANMPSITTTITNGVRSSPRPATAGLATSRSSISSLTPRNSEQKIDNGPHKDVGSYFESFKKEELRELLAQSTANWLLSPDFRGQAGFPIGVISNLKLSQEPHMTLLFPKEKNLPDLEYKELHQIVRELTSGIFGVNQMPHLCFESNFDLSATCQLPVAYKDTRVDCQTSGFENLSRYSNQPSSLPLKNNASRDQACLQIGSDEWRCLRSQALLRKVDILKGQVLIAVDYAMKSLWHGVCVTRSKRERLSERWRTLLDVNSATGEFNVAAKKVVPEFETAGQENITSNPVYEHVYHELNSVDPSHIAAEKENKFFNSYSDFVRCVMTLTVSKVQSSSVYNVIAFDALYDVTSAVTLPDNDFISPADLQKLRRRLRHQMKMIRKGLALNPTARRNIALLKFISATSLILVALRRRLMKAPDVDGLLPALPNDILRTESELPPFAIGKPGDHPCETFAVDKNGERRLITHAHGEIQFDYDTCDLEEFSDQKWCHTVHTNAANQLTTILSGRPRPEYIVPTTELDRKEYYVVHIPLTTYYPASPPMPSWLHARYQMLSSMRPRKLPMTDLQLAEMFKQIFGFKVALANKSTDASLKLCACRGLVAPFITLMRKAASSTFLSPDLQGMTLLHYACIHNQSSILSLLLSQKPNLSTRRTEINSKSTRATALLFASRCGSLECATALLASKANPMLSDGLGRSAIHNACAADQLPIARALLRRHPGLLETPATGGDNSTPLLVAASSGALLTLKFLIKQGANITALDASNDGAVQRAALNFHADVLEYFIKITEEESKSKHGDIVKVWEILVEMLKSPSVVRQDAALRCLEVLLHRVPVYWRPLLDAGAVTPLVSLLQSNKRRPKSSNSHSVKGDTTYPPIRSLACSVVCLMSEQDSVRREVADAGAIPTLISLLKPVRVLPRGKKNERIDEESLDERCELQSRSSVVLSDLAHVNATSIADNGGIAPLVDLLQLDVVDVLVNAVTTLSALCRGDTSGDGDIQARVMEFGAAGFLVDFLGVRDDALQTASADAIAAVCFENMANQNEFVALGALSPLVAILRGHCIAAQIKAALAVDCITKDNTTAQHAAALEKAPDALCRLFQIWSDNVKERGACALWALAGSHPEQQRVIAHRIGTKQIIDMLLSKSDVLQWIGCQAVKAISRSRISGQEILAQDGAIPPLVRLLRLERTSRRVIMATLDAIKSMCIGVAQMNNKKSQSLIAEEGAVELLLDRIWQTTRDESMQVDLLLCLAYVVTGCQGNEDRLNNLGSFGFEILLELLNSVDISVKFLASSALAVFAFNRLPQQQRMLKLGGIPCSVFNTLLGCKDEIIQAGAAFQLVVLARVVASTTVVDASARGIIVLVKLLDSEDFDVIISAERYLASLSHTRAGVPDAIVTSGAVAKLLIDLRSEFDQIRTAAAQALGYLSFNRKASRELMSACRATEGVYEALVGNMDEDGKISEEFVAEFKRQSTIGLPIPKALPKREPRPQTADINRRNKTSLRKTQRSMRARSISPARHVVVADAPTSLG